MSGQADPKNDKAILIGAIVTISVAIIGCFSAVAVAGIEPISNWILNRTPVPTSTDVSSTVEPTASATDAVDTPELSCILNHNCPASEDWVYECIAEYNWNIYSSSDIPELPKDENECYSQPILDVFYTKADGLYIFAEHKALTSSRDFGMFTQLPQNGSISVSLDLDKIDNGQVWFGIFEQPNVHSAGVLLVAPPGEGDVRRQAFALKTMPSEKKIQISNVFENSSGKYNLGFELEYGSIIANAEGISMTPISFTPRTRWLFIGYRAKLNDLNNGTAVIKALFTNLKIVEK